MFFSFHLMQRCCYQSFKKTDHKYRNSVTKLDTYYLSLTQSVLDLLLFWTPAIHIMPLDSTGPTIIFSFTIELVVFNKIFCQKLKIYLLTNIFYLL